MDPPEAQGKPRKPDISESELSDIIKQNSSHSSVAMTAVVQPLVCLSRVVMPNKYDRRGISDISVLVGRERGTLV